MNLHEYQARQLLKAAGIPQFDGDTADTPESAEQIATRLGGKVVVKAQVHSGGRGKAGGVKVVDGGAAARAAAAQILGMRIKGLVVNKVLVVPAATIASEAYLGIVLDRESQRPLLMASPAGGVDIEEVAAQTPDKIRRLAIDPRYGLLPHQAIEMALFLYSDFNLAKQAALIMSKLYQVFIDNDASLVEINPLITTPAGEVIALDAKISIDDNALYRHRDIESMRDELAEAPSETAARNADLTFIKLDGNVGCVVNGAGLAMATMDLVKYYGGDPANFLDIGGSSNPAKVVNALRIITADPQVKAILFNIFGGITRTDDVANGIKAALAEFPVQVPIVVRLTGTNEAVAVKILNELGMEALSDMDEAVSRVVAIAKEAA